MKLMDMTKKNEEEKLPELTEQEKEKMRELIEQYIKNPGNKKGIKHSIKFNKLARRARGRK